MNTRGNRKFFRVECKTPICSQLSIVKVNNKTVTTGTGNICVENISAGGLKFLSALNLPISDSLIIEFKLTIIVETTAFYGYIVRKEEVSRGAYRYGVQFVNGVNEQFINKLNEFNKEIILKNSILCSGNVLDCIKRYRAKSNRRLSKRYEFNMNFVAKMKVDTIINKDSESQWYNILINNISQTGIEFTSNFKVPINEDTILKFRIIINNRKISVRGHVLWKTETEDDKYIYGVKFHTTDSQNKMIAQVLDGVEDFSLENGLLTRKCIDVKFNYSDSKDNNYEWWV